jgi:hypothetical protein
MWRLVAVAFFVMTTATLHAASPLICGALWWMPYQPQASYRDYEAFVESQRSIGFDVLWILGTSSLMEKAAHNEKEGKPYDPLDMVLRVADEKSMRVIVDLPQCGWYGKSEAADVARQVDKHIQAFWKRYGSHRCLWGWYLNYEINPLSSEEKQESAWWRAVWRDIAASCHRASPRSAVTISPFFLLDDKGRRGFHYLRPTQYAAWWEETLRQTKIDVLMLQDSGAEHLAFFTLADREPFFSAMQAACRRSGAHFWVNVESAEADVADWDAFISRERANQVPWRIVPIDKLASKLELASRYGERIINWGYFPYTASDRVAAESTPVQREAYSAYKKHYLQHTTQK